MRRLVFCIVLLLSAGAALAQGHIDYPERLDQIKPGVTTADEVEKLLGKAGRRMSFPRQGIDSLEYEMRLYGDVWIVSIAITPDNKVRDVQRRKLNFGM